MQWRLIRQSVYGPSALTSLEPCGNQHLVTKPSGVFLYQPGCPGSRILLGKVDGSGITSVSTPSDLSTTGGFTCSARDPAGGFFVMANGQSDAGPRLYHLAENGAVHVRTEHPSARRDWRAAAVSSSPPARWPFRPTEPFTSIR